MRLITVLFVLLMFNASVFAESAAVRIKDIGRFSEVRANQLMGFGLVVGLKNSGDSSRSEFTKIALSNLLNNMQITDQKETMFKSRNVASVMVTAELPPFSRTGQRIDVSVSSVGDAKSLKGGTLLQSPLKGADGKVYAVAQGPLVVGGAHQELNSTSYAKNQTTVGRISNGAIVESEVAVVLSGLDVLHFVLHKTDFTTAARVAYVIKDSGMSDAIAIDASTVRVNIDDSDKRDVVDFIARLEELTVNPDSRAKVVVSERTGTVVIGENVVLAPVAVSQGNISVKIENDELTKETQITYIESNSQLKKVAPGVDLASLVDALNAVGTTPRELISILQAIKEAGALSADLEII